MFSVVGLKVWSLFMITETKWHENKKGKMTETPRKRTEK